MWRGHILREMINTIRIAIRINIKIIDYSPLAHIRTSKMCKIIIIDNTNITISPRRNMKYGGALLVLHAYAYGYKRGYWGLHTAKSWNSLAKMCFSFKCCGEKKGLDNFTDTTQDCFPMRYDKHLRYKSVKTVPCVQNIAKITVVTHSRRRIFGTAKILGSSRAFSSFVPKSLGLFTYD